MKSIKLTYTMPVNNWKINHAYNRAQHQWWLSTHDLQSKVHISWYKWIQKSFLSINLKLVSWKCSTHIASISLICKLFNTLIYKQSIINWIWISWDHTWDQFYSEIKNPIYLKMKSHFIQLSNTHSIRCQFNWMYN